MKCSKCHCVRPKLVNLFVCQSREEANDKSSISPDHGDEFLCESCIIGNDVPVYREHLDEWNIGEVTDYDECSSKHFFVFPNGDTDWCIVHPSPFTAHIDHHMNQAKLDQNHFARCVLDLSPCSSPILGAHPPHFPHHFFLDNPLEGQHKDSTDPEIATWSSKQSDLKASNYRSTEQEDPYLHVSPPYRPLSRTPYSPDGLIYSTPTRTKKRPRWESDISPVRIKTPDNISRRASKFSKTGVLSKSQGQLEGIVTKLPPIPKKIQYGSPPKSCNVTKYKLQENRSEESHKKMAPKMWSLEEDQLLLAAVQKSHKPVKWPFIARTIPERTGKQCRERYLNHLRDQLKVEGWSVKEDALIFHLYLVYSSKWTMISKFLPGRTDNSIKNRFHHLRRRLEKDKRHVHHYDHIGQKFVHMEALQNLLNSKEDKCKVLKNMREVVGYVAIDSLQNGASLNHFYEFGSFHKAKSTGEMCKRCNLFAPSVQTGRTMCDSTGWCETCTKIPPYMSRDMLRLCLSVRK